MLNNGKEGHEDFALHRTLESMATQMQSYVLGIDFVTGAVCEFALKSRKVFFNFFCQNGICEALKFCLQAFREAAIVTRWSLW